MKETRSRFREHTPKVHIKEEYPIDPIEIDPEELATCDFKRRIKLLNAYSNTNILVLKAWWKKTHWCDDELNYHHTPPIYELEAILNVVLVAENEEEIIAGIKAFATICYVNDSYVSEYVEKLNDNIIPRIENGEITSVIILKYLSIITCLFTRHSYFYINFLIKFISNMIYDDSELDETTTVFLWLLTFSSNDVWKTEIETIMKASNYIISKISIEEFEYYTRTCYEKICLYDTEEAQKYKEYIIKTIDDHHLNKKLKKKLCDIAEEFNEHFEEGNMTIFPKDLYNNKLKFIGYGCYTRVICSILDFLVPFRCSSDYFAEKLVKSISEQFGSGHFEDKPIGIGLIKDIHKEQRKDRKAKREYKEARMNEYF